MSVPVPAWFDHFIADSADRGAVLVDALAEAGCSAQSVRLAGGHFIVAQPRASVRDHRYRMKVITAHHDRVPGTPGALDNSAACLQLLRFISTARHTVNSVAVFTDHEELSGDALEAQGAFVLGQAFASLGLGVPMVFSLDVTGRGDTLILSSACAGLGNRPQAGGQVGPGNRLQAGGQVGPGNRLQAGGQDGPGNRPQAGGHRGQGGGRQVEGPGILVAEVEAMAGSLVQHLGGRMPLLRAAVPFGEDLGFLLAGVPALVCTVLPALEAAELSGPGSLPPWASTVKPRTRMPLTWSILHGPDDTPAWFDMDAFGLMERFLSRLGDFLIPVWQGKP